MPLAPTGPGHKLPMRLKPAPSMAGSQGSLAGWNERTMLTLGFLQKIASGSKDQGGNDHSDDHHCDESFLPGGKIDWK